MKEHQYYTLIIGFPDHGIASWGPSKLQELLDEGWTPVRETPMGGG